MPPGQRRPRFVLEQCESVCVSSQPTRWPKYTHDYVILWERSGRLAGVDCSFD